MSEEDINIQKKLLKVSDTNLKQLVEDARKIREELGDAPEIRDIELDIVNTQSYARRLGFINGVKLLFGFACLGISSFTVASNHSVDINNGMLIMISMLTSINAFTNLLCSEDTDELKVSLNEIKNKIEKLKLMEENKNLKQQLKDAGLMEIEQAENFEGEEHAKRR